ASYGPYWGAGCHTAVHGYVPNYQYHINFPYGREVLAQPPYNYTQYATGRLALLQYAWGFGSWHPGGANFLFGDGSVHFLPDGMDFAAFRALNSINGGETVRLDF